MQQQSMKQEAHEKMKQGNTCCHLLALITSTQTRKDLF